MCSHDPVLLFACWNQHIIVHTVENAEMPACQRLNQGLFWWCFCFFEQDSFGAQPNSCLVTYFRIFQPLLEHNALWNFVRFCGMWFLHLSLCIRKIIIISWHKVCSLVFFLLACLFFLGFFNYYFSSCHKDYRVKCELIISLYSAHQDL